MTVVGEAWVRIRADGKTFPAETKAATAPGLAAAEAESGASGRRSGEKYATGFGPGAKRAASDVESSTGRIGKATEDAGSHVNKLGILSQLGFGRLASAATLGTAGVVAGAAVAIGASVKMASTFQESTTQLVTGAGESAKNIDMVRDGLLHMAGQVGVSANDLAKGMYLVESAGFHGAAGLTIMKTAAEGAKVGGADMATVADTLTSALNAYHEPASKATSVTNDLIATVARGKTHMQDLASSLGQVLPISAALHVKLPEVTGAMATMTTQGTSAGKAATSLRFLMSALVNPTSKASSTMQDLGLTASKVGDTLTHKGLQPALEMITDAVGKKFPKGSAQYTAAIANMVGGTRGMTAALELSGSHAAVWTKNTQAIGKAAGDTSGKVHGWALVQGDFGTQMSRVGAALGAFAIKIGTLLLPPLTAAAKATANFVSWLGDKLGPILHTVGGYIGGFMHALGGIFSGSGVKGQTSKIGQAFSGIDGVVKGVVSVIMSYIKGLVSFWGAIWNGLVKIVRTVVNTIKGYLADHAAAVHKTFAAVGATLKVIANTFSTVFAVIRRVVQIAVSIITDLWNRFGKNLLAHIHTELNAIIQVIRGVFNIIQGIFNVVLGILTGKWGRAWNGIKQILSGVWNVIKGLVKLSMDRISAIIGAGMAVLSAVWRHVWGAIKDVAGTIWHAILALIRVVWGAIHSYLAGQLHDFLSFWTGIWNTIKHAFGVVWDAIKTAARVAWGAIRDFFVGAFHGFVTFWSNWWTNIKHNFGVVWDGIKTIAKNLWGEIEGFFHTAVHTFGGWWSTIWNTIKKTFSDVWGGIKTVAQDVWAGIKFAIKTGVNDIIGVINFFINALDKIPFVGKVLHPIGKLGGGGVVGGLPTSTGIAGGLPVGGFHPAAGGGVLPGYAPGVDSIPYMLSPGEGVLVPEAVKAIGPSGIYAINRAYAGGRANPAAHAGMQYGAAGVGAGVALEGRVKGWDKKKQKDTLANILAHHADGASLMQLFIEPLAKAAEASVGFLGSLVGGGPVLPDIAKSGIEAIAQNAKSAADPIWAGGSNAQRNSILEYAKKFIGTPYVWGGAEPGGFDCSGFTSFVLHHFKIPAPRTAHEQQAWAGPESKAVAMPADLIFYGRPAEHVGFWLGGDKYLDAPHTGTDIAVQPIYDTPNWGAVPGLSRAAATGSGFGNGVRGSAAGNRAIGERIAKAQGVDFSAMDYIVFHESGWNNTAQSPTSTAYGLAQFEDMTWPSYGGKTSDPTRQIEDMIKYTNDRYGGMDQAEAYWRVHHNYDTGGWLDPGVTHAVNGTGKREGVMPEDVMVDAITRIQNPKALINAVDELTDYAAQIRDLVQSMGGAGSYRGVTSA